MGQKGIIWNRRKIKPKWGITAEMNLWIERDENDSTLRITYRKKYEGMQLVKGYKYKSVHTVWSY